MTAQRPWVDFQQAKARLSFADVFRAFGIENRFVRRGDTWRGCCPLPQHVHNAIEPNDQQFVVNRKRGEEYDLYRCFGDCASQPWGGGDVLTFCRAMLDWCDEKHLRLWLAKTFPDKLDLTRPAGQSSTKKAGGEPLGQKDQSPPAATSPATVSNRKPAIEPLRFKLRLDLEAALPYLKSRGISRQTAERYGCGLCSRGMFAGYCCFPLFRWPRRLPEEHPCGYLGRLPVADPPSDQSRYKFPADFEKSRVLFGLEQALEHSQSWLIVVEGVISAMLLAQHGMPAVAILGSSLSDEQAAVLEACGRNQIALCFDGDEAGRRGMRVAAGKLIRHLWTRVIRLPDNAQPDRLALADLRQLVSTL